LDEEGEVEFRRPIKQQNLKLDLQTNIRAMVEDAF